ncbi:MAG: hypothetical protein ACTSRG_19235, partial [Candidatus Helarchaeota archaeon]
IKIAEKTVIKNYDDLLDLDDKIRRSMELKFRSKSILFRLIVICLRAVLEMNFEQLGLLLTLDRSPKLSRLLKEFKNIPSISEEELCKTKKYFEPFWKDIEDLAFKIKADYHSLYQEHADLKFIKQLLSNKKKRPYGIALLLKGLNFARWYGSEIIPRDKTYSNSSLLRALFHGSLMVIKRGTAGLNEDLNEPIFNTSEGYIDIGDSLGFYFGIPSLTTL